MKLYIVTMGYEAEDIYQIRANSPEEALERIKGEYGDHYPIHVHKWVNARDGIKTLTQLVGYDPRVDK